MKLVKLCGLSQNTFKHINSSLAFPGFHRRAVLQVNKMPRIFLLYQLTRFVKTKSILGHKPTDELELV